MEYCVQKKRKTQGVLSNHKIKYVMYTILAWWEEEMSAAAEGEATCVGSDHVSVVMHVSVCTCTEHGLYMYMYMYSRYSGPLETPLWAWKNLPTACMYRVQNTWVKQNFLTEFEVS